MALGTQKKKKNLSRALFANVRKPWFIECFGTAEVFRIVSSTISFKMEVNKDRGPSAYAMADWCRRVLELIPISL